VLDDIVSELWRKENVTSGYCPRYRYTLIAMLTLGNLYYICVVFSSNTHHRRKCATPAHFLRVIRRSFMWIVCWIMWIVRSGVRWVIFVRHSCGNCSLGHSFSWELFVGSLFGSARAGFVRWVILLLVVGVFALSCGLFVRDSK
jgi:hypothetical protein